MELPPPPVPTAPWETQRGPGRPILVIATALAAVAVYLVSALVAARSLRPFTPRQADTILVAGALLVGALSATAASWRTIADRRTGLILVAALAALAPPAMVRWMPGVAHPREFPIPGAPDHVTAAAPWGSSDLYLMPDGRPDATFALTETPDVEESFPQLAPDGHRLAFAAVGPDGTSDLYLMELDADQRPATVRLLADGPGSLSDTCWSPDGERLLVRSDDASGVSTIFELDVDSGSMRRFLENASNPQWSPDGRRLAFVGYRRDAPGNADIFVADATGGDAQPVIDTGDDDYFPAWSPDGRWLAFTSAAHGGDRDVYVARADGVDVRNLTADVPAQDVSGGWSPRGQILFLSDRADLGGTFLYFMERDGSDVRLSLIL